MSADVLILPTRRIERDENDTSLLVQCRLSQADWSRLVKFARLWNVTVQEAAEMLLQEAIKGRGR